MSGLHSAFEQWQHALTAGAAGLAEQSFLAIEAQSSFRLLTAGPTEAHYEDWSSCCSQYLEMRAQALRDGAQPGQFPALMPPPASYGDWQLTLANPSGQGF